MAMIMAIKIIIAQRAAGQQTDSITHGVFVVTVAEHFTGAGLGVAG